ncbi:MAG: DNA replication/repair protein RecF [Actinomycetaceae bacterium]|nr:DNA replication/repair protein RecF [Actinomycetaceae bacterium]
MYVSHLALDDFRSYKHQVIEFEPGITVLLGPNGQGKTNLVEAIAYLANFSSHRVAADTALVRFPSPEEEPAAGAVIRAKVNAGHRDRILELEIIRGRANRARLNRNQVRPRDLLGIVKAVVFAPEDLDLVKGDPAGRRRFLDEIAQQMWPVYGALKSDFDKVSRQRAALLKQMGKDRRSGRSVDFTGLTIWNDQYVPLSRQLLAYRLKLVDMLQSPVKAAHDIVADQARDLQIAYEHSLQEVDGIDIPDVARLALEDPNAYEQALRAGLDAVVDSEIARGVNLIGPHRDELAMTLDRMPVKGYASHGESWSVALALRLGSFETLIEEPRFEGDEPQTPILILDDVFSELDGMRRKAVLDTIMKAQQVFITVAVGTDLPEGLHARTILVRLDETEGTVCSPVDALEERDEVPIEVDEVD